MKQAVAALTTKTDGLQENVTGIETVVNQIASGGSGSTSGIRHIQRDIFNIYNDSSKEISLTGFSNLNKMIVILNSKGMNQRTAQEFGNCVYCNLTLNKLTIYGKSNSTINGSYQVIEFN